MNMIQREFADITGMTNNALFEEDKSGLIYSIFPPNDGFDTRLAFKK